MTEIISTMSRMLKDGANKLNITLDDKKVEQLIGYCEILTETNKTINLTRITEPQDVVTKHFLDSMTPLLTGCVNGRVIDVGTGAGFPGLVLKCVKPDIELTLLDSLNKRIGFLKAAADTMGIDENITFLHSRAEDAAQSNEHREKYDTVVSRAVANLRTLSEWCLPFVKCGGYMLALKGPLADEELENASGTISALGGEVTEIFNAEIPFTDLNHKIVVIKKLRRTPSIFPRKGKKATEIPAEIAVKKQK